MFARQLNLVRLDLTLKPAGPLLIRRGRTGADPTRPDLECVRTAVEGRPSVYVPGSSLKGVMRAHAERLLTSEGVPITPTFDPRGKRAFRQEAAGDAAYVGTCPLGRTFGNLHLKGHLSVSDLLPGGRYSAGSTERLRALEAANRTEQRNGVGIDRLLGSAKGGALFDQEVVVQGEFDGRLLLRNVQLYQLALVLLVLRDLDQGFVQLGSGTTRGNGFVNAEVRQLVVETRLGGLAGGQLRGAGELLRVESQKYGHQGLPRAADYRLLPGDELSMPSGLGPKRALMRDRLEVGAQKLAELAEALVEGPWQRFLDTVHQDRSRWSRQWIA